MPLFRRPDARPVLASYFAEYAHFNFMRYATDVFFAVSLLWALHHSVRFIFQALKTTLSLKTGLRA